MADRPETPPPPPPRAVGPSVPLVPQLPPHGTPVERIGQHTKGLVDDVKDWVELRIRLLQTEIHDQLRGKANELIFRYIPKIIPVLMASMGGLMLLLAAGFGIGWWLGHPFWGFLILGALLTGGGYGMYWWYQRQAPLNPDSPHHPENRQSHDGSNRT